MLAVTSSGTAKTYTVTPDESGAILNALHRLIGGRQLDRLRLGDFEMWLDEDGLLSGARVNRLASLVAARLGGPRQLYVGIAVFTGPLDEKGNATSLSAEALARLKSVLAEAAKERRP